MRAAIVTYLPELFDSTTNWRCAGLMPTEEKEIDNCKWQVSPTDTKLKSEPFLKLHPSPSYLGLQSAPVLVSSLHSSSHLSSLVQCKQSLSYSHLLWLAFIRSLASLSFWQYCKVFLTFSAWRIFILERVVSSFLLIQNKYLCDLKSDHFYKLPEIHGTQEHGRFVKVSFKRIDWYTGLK